MKEVLEFLENAGTYYLATVKDNKPYVRPFGTVNIFEDKLYIQSGKKKECAKQIEANPYVEISAFDGKRWIRVSGKLVADERIEAKKSMLDKYPNLRGMYNEFDGNTVVYYFTDAVATIYSFTENPVIFKF